MGADRRRLISPLEQTEADRRRLISPLGKTEADTKRLKNPLEQMQPAVWLQQGPRIDRPPVTAMAEMEERIDRPPVTAMAEMEVRLDRPPVTAMAEMEVRMERPPVTAVTEMDRPPLQRTRSDISWQDFYAISRSFREGKYFTVSSMHMKLNQFCVLKLKQFLYCMSALFSGHCFTASLLLKRSTTRCFTSGFFFNQFLLNPE
jgi:hypothetical protein